MRKRLTGLFGAVATALFVVACAQTDTGITSKVKSKFASDDVVKAYQIDVDTKDAVVTLSGQVQNPTAKERAVTLARATEGVRDVVDNLKVGEGSAALPGEHPATGTAGAADRTSIKWPRVIATPSSRARRARASTRVPYPPITRCTAGVTNNHRTRSQTKAAVSCPGS